MPRPPIPPQDYQRIFRVVKTILEGMDSDPSHSCIFFSVAGAAILKKIYGKQCMPVAGAACYAVDDKAGTVLAFARRDGEAISSDDDAFHCWIQCEDYIIDFMAPVFRESLQRIGFTGQCSRRMFQKPRSRMVPSPNDLSRPGDFYLQPNVDLTMATMQRFFARYDTQDLVNVCLNWYQRPPKEMRPEMSIIDDLGNVVNVKLSGLTLEGIW